MSTANEETAARGSALRVVLPLFSGFSGLLALRLGDPTEHLITSSASAGLTDACRTKSPTMCHKLTVDLAMRKTIVSAANGATAARGSALRAVLPLYLGILLFVSCFLVLEVGLGIQGVEERVWYVQGYLAHEKMPTPLGLP